MQNHVTHVMMTRTESRSIKVDKTSRFYAIRTFYQAESIFLRIILIYISNIDLSLANSEL